MDDLTQDKIESDRENLWIAYNTAYDGCRELQKLGLAVPALSELMDAFRAAYVDAIGHATMCPVHGGSGEAAYEYIVDILRALLIESYYTGFEMGKRNINLTQVPGVDPKEMG